MKFKLILPLVLILIVSLSLSAVSADDNMTEDGNNSDDETNIELKIISNEPDEGITVDNPTDITWTIDITAGGRNYENITVETMFSEGLRYKSHEVDGGSYKLGPIRHIKVADNYNYNPDTGTWIVGNIKANETKTINLTVKLNPNELKLSNDTLKLHGGVEAYLIPNITNGNVIAVVFFIQQFKTPVYIVVSYDSKGEDSYTLTRTQSSYINFDEYSNYREVTVTSDERSVNAQNSRTQSPLSISGLINIVVPGTSQNANGAGSSQNANKTGSNSTANKTAVRLSEKKNGNPIAVSILALLGLAGIRRKRH